MSLNKGDKAPNFTLWSADREEISLENQLDKNVVLLFFPLAFTGVCTAELCGVRDEMPKYEELDAKVFGISVDSAATLAKFKEDQGYNFDLLSDFNKDVSKQYDTLYDEFVMGMKGVSKRSAFVIDKNGEVQYAEVLENAGEQPNFDKIKETLASLS